MKLNNRIGGFFWLAVALFACFKSLQVEVGTIRSPGPGFVPFWAGVVLALLTVVLLVKSFTRAEDSGREVPIGRGSKWIRVLLLLLILCLYALFLQRIGYLLSTFGLMLCLLSMAEKTRWWTRVLISLLISTATYLIFDNWLHVQLPGGILG
jgi:putative tricarboxylic transport membrane protein